MSKAAHGPKPRNEREQAIRAKGIVEGIRAFIEAHCAENHSRVEDYLPQYHEAQEISKALGVPRLFVMQHTGAGDVSDREMADYLAWKARVKL